MADKEYIEREELIRHTKKQRVIIKDGTSVAEAMRIQGNAFRRCVETCSPASDTRRHFVRETRIDRGRVLYSVYDTQDHDLPVIVAATAKECANRLGIKESSFRRNAWLSKNGKKHRYMIYTEKQ